MPKLPLLVSTAIMVLLCGTAYGQTKSTGVISEEAYRRIFVTECMGPKADTKTMAFCNCSFTSLLARYGLKSYVQQDAIVRASSSKELALLASLAWAPEFNICRAK